ncbi:MAG TPA: nitroreductase family protein [Acetobacteraceae bacterium]|jgi:nitroreductase|nr:nitroreductase family protein [Acetobacteraceae bacterium]
MPDIGLFEAIHTARSLRRLKPDPVPEGLIAQVLDAAIRASSAGNAQNWAFLVVRDSALRRQLGAIYRKASNIAAAMYTAKGRPAHLSEAQYQRLMATGAHLWDHMGDAPVILIPCLRRPDVPPVSGVLHDAELAYANRIRGASIYPAVQNIILACRALGLGTTITTNHLRCEDAVRALLGLPDDVDSFAMMPIGWPIDPFGPLSRKPLSAVVHADRWGTAWPG